MLNPASDPFMVSQLRGMGNRPRVKVRIVAATGLPERGPNKSTHATCMAKNKKSSMFRTKDAWDAREPIWDEPGGQMVMRWVPGDALKFCIMDKDRGSWVPNMMQSDATVAQCELRSDEYFPNGLQTSLPLFTANGYPIPGAELRVEVQIYGVEKTSLGGKISGLMNVANWDMRSVKHGIENAPAAIIAQWYQILGEPADDRTKGDLGMLIGLPFIIFIFLTWMSWAVRHFNTAAVVMIFGLTFLIAVGMGLMGVTTHKKSKIPFFAIGCLMLISVIFAVIFSNLGWNNEWRQWWWMKTGIQYGATAATPAEARSDAAVITFQNVKAGSAWTSVDTSRAAGYRGDGGIYCAAPILDPTEALGDIMRVNYWAIGINCCDDFGSFTCDDSRNVKASVGVVMVGSGSQRVGQGGGMPCASCNTDEFRLATLKAAGVYNMVSAPGALYVRYVTNAKIIENQYLAQCVFSFFSSLLFAIVFFGTIGFITNYKALGKPGHFPLYNLLTPKPKKFVPPPEVQAKQPMVITEDTAVEESPWTLVLSPATNGQMNLAAVNNQDTPGNYGT